MISKPALAEAVAALRSILAALGRACADTGTAGAALTYAISILSAGAAARIYGADLGAIATCFDLAVAAGVDQTRMTAVYTAAAALSPRSPCAQIVVALCKAQAVIRIATIVTAATYTSRDDIDDAIALIEAAFADVELAAGNSFQAALYQALVTLRGAATATLNDASYPLPELIDYGTGSTVSALALAQRLYGDGARAVELAQENRVFHPAFMPLTGRALSQ